ncbi:signal peptidase I [Photobacterium sp. 53610]|uniref:signal peptidase I n=1 Tax=Photobacterium sp. 53610 TaxID=3102789 RepID=UPI002ED8E9D1
MERKPQYWVAILLGLFTGPLGYLYVRRWKYAAVFFSAVVVAALFLFYFNIKTDYLAFINVLFAAHLCWLIRQGKTGPDVWYARWWGISGIFAAAFGSTFLLRTFVLEPFEIPGQSMSPMLNPGEKILVSKMGYRAKWSYGRLLFTEDASQRTLVPGDMYVFVVPDTDVLYIKRLIGIPGDKIVISDGEVLRNGEPLATHRQPVQADQVLVTESLGEQEYQILRDFQRARPNELTIQVPEDHYFFLGDNRDNSYDSRNFGVIPSERIVGKVVYHFE